MALLMKTLARELQSLVAQPEEGIVLHMSESNLADVQADLEGPQGTPYEGGTFRIRLTCGPDYPQAPPAGHFLTKIFHPNVELVHGKICVNVLQKDWKPEMGLRHVLVVIKCLLVHTNPESALNEEAGRLLQEDYEAFACHARLMTSIHASRSSKPALAKPAGGSSEAPDVGAQPLGACTNSNTTANTSPGKRAKPAADAKGTSSSVAAAKAKKGLRRL